MSKMGKFKRFLIEPNKTHWNKPVEYYKEYVNYVETFNSASKKAMEDEVGVSPDVKIAPIDGNVEQANLGGDAFKDTIHGTQKETNQ